MQEVLLLNSSEFDPYSDDRSSWLSRRVRGRSYLAVACSKLQGKDDSRSGSAANSNVITKRRAVLWAMERGVSCRFDAAVIAGKGGAIPLKVSLEATSVAFFVFILYSWLMRGIPVVAL